MQTPVGMKCRECGLQKGGKLFTLSPAQAALAAVIALLFGLVAGWGVEFLGFYTILVAVPFGTFAGEMILRVSGRKRGIKMEIIAGAAIAFGAIGGRMLVAMLLMRAPGLPHPPLGALAEVVDLIIPSPFPIIALIVAIASAIGRIRYI